MAVVVVVVSVMMTPVLLLCMFLRRLGLLLMRVRGCEWAVGKWYIPCFALPLWEMGEKLEKCLYDVMTYDHDCTHVALAAE